MRKGVIVVQVLISFLMAMLGMMFVKTFKSSIAEEWIKYRVAKWARRTLRILRINAEVIGQEKVKDFPTNQAVFIVSNHQSYTDIPILLFAMNRLFGFVAKEELNKIPLLNFWMRELKCVMINRKKFTNAIRFIKKSEKAGTLNPLTLFPEGTRSKNGEIGDFKPGVLKLAWSVRAHIQPVVIKGSRASFENVSDKSSKAPYPVKIQLLAPIVWTPEFEKDYDLFSANLKEKMIEAYKQM